MATKDHCLLLKDQQNFVVNDNLNDQFKNVNLNQNNNCFAKNFQSNNVENDKVSNYDFRHNNDSQTRQNSIPFGKTKLSSSLANPNAQNEYGKKEEPKEGKSFNANSSTLSLHITAYENSIEATSSDTINDEKGESNKKKENTSSTKSWKAVKEILNGSSSSVKYGFELPRQQEGDKMDTPEVMQFKASQRLSNVNGASSSCNTEHANIMNQNITDDLQLSAQLVQQPVQSKIRPASEKVKLCPGSDERPYSPVKQSVPKANVKPKNQIFGEINGFAINGTVFRGGSGCLSAADGESILQREETKYKSSEDEKMRCCYKYAKNERCNGLTLITRAGSGKPVKVLEIRNHHIKCPLYLCQAEEPKPSDFRDKLALHDAKSNDLDSIIENSELPPEKREIELKEYQLEPVGREVEQIEPEVVEPDSHPSAELILSNELSCDYNDLEVLQNGLQSVLEVYANGKKTTVDDGEYYVQYLASLRKELKKYGDETNLAICEQLMSNLVYELQYCNSPEFDIERLLSELDELDAMLENDSSEVYFNERFNSAGEHFEAINDFDYIEPQSIKQFVKRYLIIENKSDTKWPPAITDGSVTKASSKSEEELPAKDDFTVEEMLTQDERRKGEKAPLKPVEALSKESLSSGSSSGGTPQVATSSPSLSKESLDAPHAPIISPGALPTGEPLIPATNLLNPVGSQEQLSLTLSREALLPNTFEPEIKQNVTTTAKGAEPLFDCLENEIILDDSNLTEITNGLQEGMTYDNALVSDDLKKKLLEIDANKEKVEEELVRKALEREDTPVKTDATANKIVEALTDYEVIAKTVAVEDSKMLKEYFDGSRKADDEVIAALDRVIDRILDRATDFYSNKEELAAFLRNRGTAKSHLLDAMLSRKGGWLQNMYGENEQDTKLINIKNAYGLRGRIAEILEQLSVKFDVKDEAPDKVYLVGKPADIQMAVEELKKLAPGERTLILPNGFLKSDVGVSCMDSMDTDLNIDFEIKIDRKIDAEKVVIQGLEIDVIRCAENLIQSINVYEKSSAQITKLINIKNAYGLRGRIAEILEQLSVKFDVKDEAPDKVYLVGKPADIQMAVEELQKLRSNAASAVPSPRLSFQPFTPTTRRKMRAVHVNADLEYIEYLEERNKARKKKMGIEM